jgi:Restriction endonuclease fold toxin 7
VAGNTEVAQAPSIQSNGSDSNSLSNTLTALSLLGSVSSPSNAASFAEKQVIQKYAPQVMGRAGEMVAGASQLTKERVFVNGRTRIVDIFNRAENFVGEVKNVGYQSLTTQLRDSLEVALSNGMEFKLFVRESTTLSSPLQKWIQENGVKIVQMSDQKLQDTARAILSK